MSEGQTHRHCPDTIPAAGPPAADHGAAAGVSPHGPEPDCRTPSTFFFACSISATSRADATEWTLAPFILTPSFFSTVFQTSASGASDSCEYNVFACGSYACYFLQPVNELAKAALSAPFSDANTQDLGLC